MKPTIKYALIFFAVFAIFKIVLKQMGLQHELYQAVILGNLLLVLLATFFSLREITKARTEPVSFIADVKSGLQTAGLYAVFTAAFVFAYYKWMDPDFLEGMRQTLISQVETAIENDAIPKGTTKHEFLEKSTERAEMIYSPGSQFTITLIGLVMMGFVYSFFLTFLNRKVLSRFS